jgi:hypothetical protein
MVRAEAGNGAQTRSLGETIAIPMPQILLNNFNALTKHGGPGRAAASGAFCREAADFA